LSGLRRTRRPQRGWRVVWRTDHAAYPKNINGLKVMIMTNSNFVVVLDFYFILQLVLMKMYTIDVYKED
jgi:hypothetical protein